MFRARTKSLTGVEANKRECCGTGPLQRMKYTNTSTTFSLLFDRALLFPFLNDSLKCPYCCYSKLDDSC